MRNYELKQGFRGSGMGFLNAAVNFSSLVYNSNAFRIIYNDSNLQCINASICLSMELCLISYIK